MGSDTSITVIKMVGVRKQEEAIEGAEEDGEAVAPSEDGLEEKMNTLFKVMSELQAAVKDLASATGASTEATRGLQEALMSDFKTSLMNDLKASLMSDFKASLMSDFKTSLIEDLKKVVTVGMPAAAAENKLENKRPDATPSKKPEAVGEAVSAPPANFQEQSAIYSKDVEVVKTERPSVEVKKSNLESPTADLIRSVLTGQTKGLNVVKRLREVTSHE